MKYVEKKLKYGVKNVKKNKKKTHGSVVENKDWNRGVYYQNGGGAPTEREEGTAT